jgi:uncharacterized protein (TIGR04255 family)
VPQLFLPRVWLVHREKALLIQVQDDRIYFNWRRLQPNAEYPRFANLLPQFERYITMWSKFLDQQGLGLLEPSVCDLSYINHFSLEGWKNLWDVGRVLSPLTMDVPYPAKSPPSSVNWGTIFDRDSSRMILSLQTLENATNRVERVLQFEIKAESHVPLKSVTAAAEWFVKANLDIVETFTSLTTEWGQTEIWGRVSS